jgi:hypothetical protein
MGPVAMTILFYSSTPYTESITAAKYPLYKTYKQRVGMLWPADTVLKIMLLTVTGKLQRVNAKVFGTGAAQQKQKKR